MLLFAQAIVAMIHRLQMAPMRILAILLGLLVSLILINHLQGVTDMVKVLWPWVLLTFMILPGQSSPKGTQLVYILGAMTILSFYAAHTFEKQVVNKDREKLEVIAERLMEGVDPVPEYLYADIESELAEDPLLWNSLLEKKIDEERLLSILRRDYFNGYWTKYDLDIELQYGDAKPNDAYAAIRDTLKLGFYPMHDAELGLNYVLKMAPEESDVKAYIRFQLDIIPEELGFPELLIEGNSLIGEQLSRYSFAHYVEGELVDRYGDFDYARKELTSRTDTQYFIEKEYWHFPFSRSGDGYIISSPRKSFMDRLTTFTYLFSLLGLLIAGGFLLERVVLSRKWPKPDLQNKVQFLVVGILFSALLIFGLGAYYYILSQDKSSNEGILQEKVSSVLIELSHKLEKEQAFGDKAKLELYLDKFSKVFFTDINLYGLDGQLMASSRPLVFRRGLLSEQMDADAYRQLTFDYESRFIHEELIGNLNYLSAYVPFVNSDKEVLAYLNLPYFAKQSELQDELSRFLVAVVNVLVLLFVFSILVAVFVSNWITRPLQLLKENLAVMRLDQRNEPIIYEGSDEIASLVAEYNNKVSELQANAELLAKSERESAWREMAKQVAHEIKNPLTPMKLSIQYLQRSKDDGGPDWEDRFKRSTNMLIEQIDSLSAIATAFSDFAKMPKASNAHFDLLALVTQTIDLFSEEPDVDLELLIDIQDEALVYADRRQLGRLLTNLIKNAIQSIPEERSGEVSISLIDKGGQYILEVKDNGIGVPQEMHDKIFVPNFTTKSTGTGLGLAMCQNIVEQAGGTIWFTTEDGVGSSFYVSIPQPEKEASEDA
jgi:two-component system nitrogen regulation sensor histidine kinase NtrY